MPRNWWNISADEPDPLNPLLYMTFAEFSVAIGHLQSEGYRPPYGVLHRGHGRAGSSRRVGTSWAQWRRYEWNPPEFLPITPALLQEYGDTDTDASDKPTWQELVAAKDVGLLTERRASLLRELDVEATERIARLYHPLGARERNKEWQVRLSGADLARQDGERVRMVAVYHALAGEIRLALNMDELAAIDVTEDSVWT